MTIARFAQETEDGMNDDCQECGQHVPPRQRHTYDHCLAQFLLNEGVKAGVYGDRRRKFMEARASLLRFADQPNSLEVGRA